MSSNCVFQLYYSIAEEEEAEEEEEGERKMATSIW
jgi:hypothetical protein